jgi:hypothetical protein
MSSGDEVVAEWWLSDLFLTDVRGGVCPLVYVGDAAFAALALMLIYGPLELFDRVLRVEREQRIMSLKQLNILFVPMSG